MIKEYKILSADSEECLGQYVNEYIGYGWEPQGGISVLPETKFNIIWYAQAMIRREYMPNGFVPPMNEEGEKL